MQLHSNTLPPDLFARVQAEAIGGYDPTKNRSNIDPARGANWEAYLTDGLDGTVWIRTIYGQLKREIAAHIPYEGTDPLNMMFYVWTPGSGINWHQDGPRFTATLYLNDVWQMKDGGLFLFKEDGETKAFNPQANTLNVNTKDLEHMVTTIAPEPEQLRYSVQIFSEPHH